MKAHPIFSKTFALWWFLLAVAVVLKILVHDYFDIPLNMLGSQGYITYVLGNLLSGLVFATPFYLLYRLIGKKWNNKVYMIMVAFMLGLTLVVV